jgi:hypothetical protein
MYKMVMGMSPKSSMEEPMKESHLLPVNNYHHYDLFGLERVVEILE